MVDAAELKAVRVTDSYSATPSDPVIAAALLEVQDGDVTLVANGALLRVYPPSACAGRRCWVHDPTPGPMMSWPIRWRDDRGTAERMCSHSIGHPEIDDVSYHAMFGRDVSVHGCDGCCED